MNLTPEQTKEAWALRSRGMSWARLGLRFKVRAKTIRNTLFPEREGVTAREHAQELRKRLRRIRKNRYIGPTGHVTHVIQEQAPSEVVAERDARYAAIMARNDILAMRGDLSFMIGDLPPPGRSALDKRGA